MSTVSGHLQKGVGGRKGRGWREVKGKGKGMEERGTLPDFYLDRATGCTA